MDEKLVSITGAKKPSGIPFVEETTPAQPQKPYRGPRNQGGKKRRKYGSDERRSNGSAPRRKRSR